MAQTNIPTARFKLITVDPGHFHAALVQKFMYADVDPVVHIYSPGGDDLAEHLKRIDRFNSRDPDPTRWQSQTYTGPDFFPRMLAEKPGNVVVLAGNNAKKADYILQCVKAGLNVLADKPMAITPGDFEKLKQAFEVAAANKVLLYDIMTERFEITTMLQRELSRHTELFGELVKGTADEPAITKESVHHFSKIVAGAPLKRPTWFYDVRQQGEGIVDVTTHLVDLIQWEAFPEQTLKVTDAEVLRARRWATSITPEQFSKTTGADQFPAGLKQDVKDGALQVYANGEFTYRLRGVHAKASVIWNFEAPPGTGDTHHSVMRGTKATLAIVQGATQNYKPVLYVRNESTTSSTGFGSILERAVESLQGKYPGIGVQRDQDSWRITIPEKYNNGHEAHFAQVTEQFLTYLRAGRLPDWEVPNMITKHATIMKAFEMSRRAARPHGELTR
jgi:predicted dehydrogenase